MNVVVLDAARRPTFHVGIEWLSVLVCVAFVLWRRNLLLGLALGVGLAAAVRALGPLWA